MIVIASDEKHMRIGLSLEFARNGFATRVAASGEEAVSFLAAADGSVACLVVDADMDGAQGVGLLHVMAERWPQTPCLVLSGAERRVSLERILEVAPRVVEKPFEARDVVHLVRAMAVPA